MLEADDADRMRDELVMLLALDGTPVDGGETICQAGSPGAVLNCVVIIEGCGASRPTPSVGESRISADWSCLKAAPRCCIVACVWVCPV